MLLTLARLHHLWRHRHKEVRWKSRKASHHPSSQRSTRHRQVSQTGTHGASRRVYLTSGRYWIYLTSVDITSPAGTATSLYADASPGLPVILDSGGTLTRLPTPLYQAIGEAFVAVFPDTFLDTASGFYVVDCAIGNSPGSVDFGFGAKTIRVAYEDVIWNLGRPELNLCVVGVLPDDGKLFPFPNMCPCRRA